MWPWGHRTGYDHDMEKMVQPACAWRHVTYLIGLCGFRIKGLFISTQLQKETTKHSGVSSFQGSWTIHLPMSFLRLARSLSLILLMSCTSFLGLWVRLECGETQRRSGTSGRVQHGDREILLIFSGTEYSNVYCKNSLLIESSIFTCLTRNGQY